MAIETVLVAVGDEDDERRAATLARVAAEEAGPSDARVVVGYAFAEEEFGEAVQRFGFDRAADRIAPGDVADRIAAVRAVRERVAEEGVETEVNAAIGETGAAAFVRMAADLEVDRVVVAGDRRSPAGKAVFGSDAQAILLDAPCPVVYVRGDAA
jgi:nucleotide-binding universal stress UspA family protein